MAKKENTLFENLKESLEEAEKYYKDENEITLKVIDSETLKKSGTSAKRGRTI